MPTYQITIPNKGTFEVSSETELTSQQAYQYALQQAEQPVLPNGELEQSAEKTWSEVGSEAVQNLPSSVAGVAGDIYEAITNPIDTAHNLVKIGAGALQEALPEKFVQWVGEDKESREMAGAVANYYADRYGSVEGFKEALAGDPAAVMMDAATVVSGGAGLAAKAGAPAKVTSAIQKGAAYVDPAYLALKSAEITGKVAAKGVKSGLGLTTGVGVEAIEHAYRAGKRGGEISDQFRSALRGKGDPKDIIEIAEYDLQKLAEKRSKQYQADKARLKFDKQQLTFDDIDSAIAEGYSQATFKGEVKNQKAVDVLQQISETVDQWKNLDPAEFHTPEGMDALKQKLWGYIENIPRENETASKIGKGIYHATSETIGSQAPIYKKMMGEYSEASILMREIKKSLSLNETATADAKMRKLQSLMRNNVQTNYGQRMTLAKELEEAGGKEFMPIIAGQALGDIMPRGLARLPAAGSVAFGGLDPLTMGYLASSSPRLVGEAAHASGQLSRATQGLLGIMPMSTQQALNLAYQAQQPKEE
jgi:predicted RecB family endonuclease